MNESTGEKIRRLRTAQKMTLEELGSAVGVGKSTVRKWEQGIIGDIRQTNLAKLAAALNSTPEDLMGWDERFNAKGELSEESSFLDHLEARYGKEAFQLLSAFVELNASGQQKALQNINDLLDVPKYRKENDK